MMFLIPGGNIHRMCWVPEMMEYDVHVIYKYWSGNQYEVV